jgi:hypothetical protein
MALPNGLTAGADVSAAEEFCIWCGVIPEKYQAGSLLLGYRSYESPAFFSVAVGQSWGSGEHRKPGSIPTSDPDRDWLRFSVPPEMVQDRGFGFRMQADFAITSRFIGVGGQIHWIYLPNHSYFGVALIVPMGRLRSLDLNTAKK